MPKLIKPMFMSFMILCLFLTTALLPAYAEGSESAIKIGLNPGTIGCPPDTEQPTLSAEYKNRVVDALTTTQDVYGQQILDKPEGPTFENVKDFFTPIMYAIAPAAQGGFLTDTGVYYIPFGQPQQLTDRGDLALTSADGSQIISNKADNLSLSTKIFVGAGGQEQFGSCLTNLGTPELYKGYLPILELQYRDHDGIEYQQESLATNLPDTNLVASYIKITAQRGLGKTEHKPINIRFQVCSNCNLHQEGNQLIDDQGRTYLYFSPGATFSNSDLVYNFDKLNNGIGDSVYIVRPVTPIANAPTVQANKSGQDQARVDSTTYWENRLSEGNLFQVPESTIMDAQRNLLIQDLLMNWRYSLGNAYEAFYQPESSTTMGTLGRYGFTNVYKQALQDLLPKSKGITRRNWEIGEKLSYASDYYRLTGDPSLIIENLEAYKAYAVDLATQHANDPNHLLERQQYSSDVPNKVYGLHQIGTALFGLQNVVSVWRELGQTDLANQYGPIADDLRVWFDKAIKQSSTLMADGSLFTKAMLLDNEDPYDHLPVTVLGSYWNLVAHYGFAAQAYAPGTPEAKATLRYLYNHGSRLLGLLKVRDGAINTVYEAEHIKFLADNDQPDQMVLSLYNQLAHGMTRNTFITGEAANVGPLASKWPKQFGICAKDPCPPPSFDTGWKPGEYYRGMYLSPNTANNGFFLRLLRLMLLNDVTNNKGEPQSLQLAFSTPRGWLENGKKIQINNAPSLFGPISYTITSNIKHNQVMADLDIPSTRPIGNLQLRLRVPADKQLIGVKVNGQPYNKFNASTETIDLTGLTGSLSIRADYR
ncbi:hypothetical protein PAECIP111891_05171 [Paenibacillus allorhizoplanae]|uniref:Uncharacterized protein n=1 Tax=Paenibacillus allorhizoplanae TaxID=2905648 RepID=A0ABM9CRP4_9BACL|nr:hypothetical protein [Paenibacillus allorhizoplanae]CAH1221396.1 hypothetical protein PAECIP111891_05171 [Paenibacillus allorhizoplanae]